MAGRGDGRASRPRAIEMEMADAGDPASVVLACYAALADVQACLSTAPDDEEALKVGWERGRGGGDACALSLSRSLAQPGRTVSPTTAQLRSDLDAAASEALALIPSGDDADDALYTPTWAIADPLDPPPSFASLATNHPPLAAALAAGHPPGRLDFSDPAAVRALTHATLVQCFKLTGWTVPPGALVPPVPARAAYLRRMALICGGGAPPPFPLRVLDVGCGANLIFSLLATSPVFGWRAVGLDVTPAALAGAAENLRLNPGLVGRVVLRAGPPPPPSSASAATPSILPHAFRPTDPPFHFSVCNPPFFESADAQAATAKEPGAGGHAGTAAETVWPDGGEAGFVGRMAGESAGLAHRVAWFSSMLGRKASVGSVKKVLAGLKPSPPEVRVFTLAAGGERTRRWVVAWSFQRQITGVRRAGGVGGERAAGKRARTTAVAKN